MELELRREEIRCWEAVCRTTLEQEETAELIVPDACPDIWQVLDGEGKLLLQRKEAMDGKAEIAGLLKGSILYQPEGEGSVETMEITLPIGAVPELAQLTRRCVLRAQPRVLSVDIHLLNPRKVLVRISWQMDLTGYLPQTLSLASMVEDPETHAIRQKTAVLRTLTTLAVEEKNVTYSDDLELPAGTAPAQKLLCTRVACSCSEARVIGTKLVFKGEARLTLLCLGEDGKLFPAEFHLPYSQLMDAGEDSEDALCDVALTFTDVKCSLEEGGRAVRVSLSLLAQGLLSKPIEVPVLADLYSTAYHLQREESVQAVRTHLAGSEDQVTHREGLEPSHVPVEILDVQARLGRAGQHREGEDRFLDQEVELVLLYQGEDGPASHRQRVTVSHRLADLGEGTVTCSAELLRAPSASMTGGGIEVTVPMAFRWSAVEEGKVPLVTKVLLGDRREEEGQRPSAVIRAVRAGETLWDVAKDCLSTEGEILEASGLSTGELYPGQMLLIPRKRP